MRIAVFSDLHGNLEALNAILADMETVGPLDQVVAAGDLAWSGPWPAEVVDRVRGLRAAAIRGNTDAFFSGIPGDAPPGKFDDQFAAQLSWMLSQLGSERAAWLAGLPFSYRVSPAPGHDLLIVHANPTDLEQPIYQNLPESDLDALLLGADGAEPDWEVLAFGHVHVPFTRCWRGKLLVDVASAGLPMDGDQRAIYAIFTWDGAAWHVEHKRVYYAVPVVAHYMRSSGMPRGKQFAERLISATYSVVVRSAVDYGMMNGD